MKAAKVSKLGKLAMPKKRQEEDMMDLHGDDQDPMLEHQEEEEGQDLDNDQEAGEPEAHKEKVMGKDPLAAVSDDDLMAEIKKRGLESKLDEQEGDEGEEESDQDYGM